MKNQKRVAGLGPAAMLLLLVLRVGVAWNGAPAPNPDPMLRVAYTWNANVSSGDWDNGGNWEGIDSGYPDDSGDDATLQGLGYYDTDIDLNAS
ncbi:MAG: hypothetical protein IT449_19310, partial [Phycisphaerales bacterium]|nr:hypothetical protein [Phycisphaerales bacterium]